MWVCLAITWIHYIGATVPTRWVSGVNWWLSGVTWWDDLVGDSVGWVGGVPRQGGSVGSLDGVAAWLGGSVGWVGDSVGGSVGWLRDSVGWLGGEGQWVVCCLTYSFLFERIRELLLKAIHLRNHFCKEGNLFPFTLTLATFCCVNWFAALWVMVFPWWWHFMQFSCLIPL